VQKNDHTTRAACDNSDARVANKDAEKMHRILASRSQDLMRFIASARFCNRSDFPAV
jgi:hypothetical protein